MTGTRIVAVELLCPDPLATAGFYAATFGCVDAAGGEGLMLGGQRIVLRPAATEMPRAAPSPSTAFQHCAVVVSDMQAAMDRLAGASGWTAISRGGPERLPHASGGATAFKFRDPDGHPLELLQFPPGAVPDVWRGPSAGPFLGIDHSAITVSDTDRAAAFWAGIGFRMTGRHMNRGAEQARLDGIGGSDAAVEVTTLVPEGGAPPHLELLRYLTPGPEPSPAPDGSPLATSLLLKGAPVVDGRPADPDGHRFRCLRP